MAIAIILAISLGILILVSVLSVSREMRKTIDGEFSGFASQNSIIVQTVIDDAASVAQNLRDYLEDSYEVYDRMVAEQPVDANGTMVPFPSKKSVVYNVDMIELNYEVENYILHTAWTTLKNNADIAGIGAFFEPYAYEDNIRDYTLYINDGDVDNQTAQSYGTHEEYSKNEYYAVAAATQKDYFTKPYTDQGITMVTAAFPIVSGGETQGVILVDINVDNFAKVKSTDEKYPTMFTDIITQDGIIVYDSDSKDFVGKSLEEILGSAAYSQIHESLQTDSAFQIEVEYDGDSLVEYYYPIQAGEELWWSSTALMKSDLN